MWGRKMLGIKRKKMIERPTQRNRERDREKARKREMIVYNRLMFSGASGLGWPRLRGYHNQAQWG